MREAIRRDPGLALLLLALALAIAIYAPTLAYGLTNYDDPWLVRDNVIVREASWANVHTILFDLHSPRRFLLTPEYLPVRDLSMMLDFALWGDDFHGFHATNLVIYLMAIAVWFFALEGMGLDRKLCGLAMLLWAVHPSHAESVAWITERKGLLGAMFAGVAVLGYARFRAGRSAAWLVLGALAAVCAVWSKAPAAFAVAAIAPLELVVRRRSWRRSLIGLAVIGVVGAAAYVPVVMLATSSQVVGTSAAGGRVETVLGVHGFYVELAAMVVPNAPSYPISSLGPSTLQLVLGAIGLVAIAAALARGSAGVRAGAILWTSSWLPVSHLVLPLQMVLVADRYLLLPSLGLAVALAAGLLRIPRGRIALTVVIVVAASLRAFDAQGSWADPRSLWARAVDSNPDNGDAWSELAELTADPAEAMAITDTGLSHVQAPRLWLRKGLLLLGSDPAAALPWLRRAADAGQVKAMSDLALLLERDHPDDALAWARRGAAAEPTSPHAQRTLGKILLDTGHPDDARVAFGHAYDYEPGNLVNRFDLALALLAVHRDDEARPHLEACLQGPPELAARARALLGR